MRWVEICNGVFYIFLLTTVSGSIFTLLWLICKICLGNEHTKLLDVGLRLCIQAYWLPAIAFTIFFGHNGNLLQNEKNGLITTKIFKLSPAMEKVISILINGWILAIIITIIYWIARKIQMKRMLAGSVSEDNLEVLACYEKMKCRLGIRRNIPLMRNDLFEIPFTVGVFRQRVVLPFYNYNEKELKVIFAHELTHCKHRDLFFKVESIFLNVVHAVNPFAYVNRHFITEYTERDCDICACEAAEGLFSTQEYYEVVLALSADRKEPMVLLSAFYVKTAALERRLQAMIAYQGRKHKSKAFVVTVIISYILGGCLISFRASRQLLALQKYYFKETRLLKAEMEEMLPEQIIPFEMVRNDNVIVMGRIDIAMKDTICNINWNIPAKTKYITEAFQVINVHHIGILMKIPEDSMVRVGLQYPDGTEHYVGKETALDYEFSNLIDGEEYCFFVENLGDVMVNVECGFICYQN